MPIIDDGSRRLLKNKEGEVWQREVWVEPYVALDKDANITFQEGLWTNHKIPIFGDRSSTVRMNPNVLETITRKKQQIDILITIKMKR
jgi:hypothetical protein